jgi:hypothetical protein
LRSGDAESAGARHDILYPGYLIGNDHGFQFTVGEISFLHCRADVLSQSKENPDSVPVTPSPPPALLVKESDNKHRRKFPRIARHGSFQRPSYGTSVVCLIITLPIPGGHE